MRRPTWKLEYRWHHRSGLHSGDCDGIGLRPEGEVKCLSCWLTQLQSDAAYDGGPKGDAAWGELNELRDELDEILDRVAREDRFAKGLLGGSA